jgi:hypothetical protein
MARPDDGMDSLGPDGGIEVMGNVTGPLVGNGLNAWLMVPPPPMEELDWPRGDQESTTVTQYLGLAGCSLMATQYHGGQWTRQLGRL